MITKQNFGIKSVLWCFESELDKEGFINNRFFWDDRFVSMQSWYDNFPSDQRMAWVRVSGIPLSYWCPDFFMKLGWMFGEPLLVDEATINRRRLDRGRILVLTSQEEVITTKVRVEVGNGSFPVTVKEESEEGDGKWIEEFLGLITVVSGEKGWSEEEEWVTNGQKSSRRSQTPAEDCEAQEKAEGWFKSG